MEPTAERRGRADVMLDKQARTDTECGDGAIADPAQGFEEFYRAEFATTVRLCRLLTGSAAVAEDLAQDAFVRIHRRFATVDNPPAYLRVTTVNICRNWHRSRSRDERRLERLVPPQDSLTQPSRELDAVVTQLPYRQRAVLVMRYWLDLTEADIALTLGCRPGTVKSLHSRALATLRKELPR